MTRHFKPPQRPIILQIPPQIGSSAQARHDSGTLEIDYHDPPVARCEVVDYRVRISGRWSRTSDHEAEMSSNVIDGV
jgi:hypothetical protein